MAQPGGQRLTGSRAAARGSMTRASLGTPSRFGWVGERCRPAAAMGRV